MAKSFNLPDAEYYLYELACENNKRYIGITSCPLKRMIEHRKGCGSRWTNKYKPVKIVRLLKLGCMSYEEACIIENYETLKVLAGGNYNIRGGRYLNPKYKFNPEKIANDLAEIPEDYRELYFTPVTLDFNFRHKTKKVKKKKKKNKPVDPWKQQKRIAEMELKKNSKRFNENSKRI